MKYCVRTHFIGQAGQAKQKKTKENQKVEEQTFSLAEKRKDAIGKAIRIVISKTGRNTA
jgi:hypothetical protein